MGEPSVILEGIESPAMVDLLYSTVHGAGRVMSRSQQWPAPTCLTRSRTDPEVIAAPLALVHSSAPTSSRPSAPQRRLTCRRVRRNGR